jgi:hypothetical protein
MNRTLPHATNRSIQNRTRDDEPGLFAVPQTAHLIRIRPGASPHIHKILADNENLKEEPDKAEEYRNKLDLPRQNCVLEGLVVRD